MAELDYYKVLGVPSSAGTSLIREQYQKLAKQHHPDHRGDESSMVLINRAYEVLSSSAKRTEYDTRRAKRKPIARSSRPTTQTSWSRTNQRAKTTNQDKIAVAIFIFIMLVALLGVK
jgi:curved DNA-binding protein CbpA